MELEDSQAAWYFKNMSQPKPSQPEEEYFAKINAEKIKALAQERYKQITQQEKENMKKAHWMRCPKCGMELHPVSFKNVTIDKCFSCNGVFLDDGELEKVGAREHGFIPALLSLFKF